MSEELSQSDAKLALLQGKDFRQTVDVALPSGQHVVMKVRPLTDQEKEQVDALRVKGLVGSVGQGSKTNVQTDFSKLRVLNSQADRLLVRFGLSLGDVQWTDAEVAQLVPTTIDALADAISLISGVDRLKVSFRESKAKRDGDGDGDDPEKRDGDQAEAGGIDH
ncbi:MAG: hypothetical protein HY678_02785 [Chloroflexi bacterium]|nr:hypothetical protein [Chloroflexota bacterium]